MDQQSYIKQLKRQPRIGMSLVDDLLKAAKELVGVVGTDLSNAINTFNDSQVLLGIGIKAVVDGNTALASKFKEAVKAATELEQRNSALNKTFGLGSVAAAELSQALLGVGGAAEKLGVSQKLAIQYATSIRNIAPNINNVEAATNKYYIGLGRVQQVLTTNLGLSAEQAESYSEFAMQNGENADESLAQTNAVAQAVAKATGNQGAFKDILAGIAKTTADVQLQYGRIPGSLAAGVAKAKSLGLEMANLSAAGKNLLNIEASIGQELEYQLLSGNRLIGNQQASAELQGKGLTNAYREATMKGDANAQADTLNTILEQEGDTLKTNLFAREQMSKLLGMDEAALSRALQKKSILEKLPGGEALFDKTGDALLEAAKTAGATEDQMQDLVKATDTRTTDQKIEEVLEMMVDKGIKATLVNQSQIVKDTQTKLVSGANNLAGVQPSRDQTEKIGAGKLAFKAVTSIPDGVISPDGSLMVSGQKGTYKLDQNDTVVAGTELGAPSKGGSDSSGLMAAIQVLVAATQEQTNHLKQLKSDPLFSSNLNAGKYS
jgi:hypothetical protein